MLTVEKYEHQHDDCEDGICDIDPNRIDDTDETKLPCVTCPFCLQIVTAELTPTTISCPNCKVTVQRNEHKRELARE